MDIRLITFTTVGWQATEMQQIDAGDQILFLMINMVSIIGLLLTFKPFFDMSSALRRS